MTRGRIAFAAGLALFLTATTAGKPAKAVEPPPGTKNFTAPGYVPDYFSNESGPFHTGGGGGKARSATPAAAAPVYAAPNPPAEIHVNARSGNPGHEARHHYASGRAAARGRGGRAGTVGARRHAAAAAAASSSHRHPNHDRIGRADNGRGPHAQHARGGGGGSSSGGAGHHQAARSGRGGGGPGGHVGRKVAGTTPARAHGATAKVKRVARAGRG